MFQDFNGQTAIITGGAGGIGKGIAKVFAEAGARVVIGDIDEKAAAQTAAEFTQKGLKAESVALDVTRADSVQKFYDKVGDFEVLCSNCGIFPQKNLLDMTEKDWDFIQAVNLKGTFLVVQEGIRRMLPKKYGRIVLTSSITGPVTRDGHITVPPKRVCLASCAQHVWKWQRKALRSMPSCPATF